jgi:hypothetical protein
MNQRIYRLPAVILGLACLILGVYSIRSTLGHSYSGLQDEIVFVLSFFAYALVGAFIAVERPKNPIGWLFLVVALSNFVWFAAVNAAVEQLYFRPEPVPALIAWLSGSWVSNIGWVLMPTFLVILFPDGWLPAGWQRALAWVNGIVFGVSTIAQALTPGPVYPARLPGLMNPTGVTALAPLLDGISRVTGILLPILIVANVVSLFYRFSRARGEERLRYTWFFFASLLLVALVILGAFQNIRQIQGFYQLEPLLFSLAIAGLPIAVAFAVLRYRLYQIETIINRTLVYATLSLLLFLLYFALVTVFQVLFQAVTGSNSSVVIVISTLVIAALFTPLRRTIQRIIDRRFFRRHYDPGQVVAEFNARARDAVDADILSEELKTLVSEALEPKEISVWLRPVSQKPPEDRGRA